MRISRGVFKRVHLLPAAVVRAHDPVHAGLDREHRVGGGLDALQHQLHARDRAEPRDVIPVQTSVFRTAGADCAGAAGAAGALGGGVDLVPTVTVPPAERRCVAGDEQDLSRTVTGAGIEWQ